MLNMIDTQDKLKNFSEQQLVTEMQQPTGSAPQFMVLGEIERRKRMRQDMQRQEGFMQPTVAQEAVSAAGVPQQGIAGLAQSLAPKTDMAQNTGVGTVQQPVKMAVGGRMSGGTIANIANLKVVRPDLYEEYKDDPEMLELTAEFFASGAAVDSEQTGLEALEAPYTPPMNLKGITAMIPALATATDDEKTALLFPDGNRGVPVVQPPEMGPEFNEFGPEGLAARTAAAERDNQERMGFLAARDAEADRMMGINDPVGSSMEDMARMRIAEEDMAMAQPVPQPLGGITVADGPSLLDRFKSFSGRVDESARNSTVGSALLGATDSVVSSLGGSELSDVDTVMPFTTMGGVDRDGRTNEEILAEAKAMIAARRTPESDAILAKVTRQNPELLAQPPLPVDSFGPDAFAQRTAAAEIQNQARLAEAAGIDARADRMMDINKIPERGLASINTSFVPPSIGPTELNTPAVRNAAGSNRSNAGLATAVRDFDPEDNKLAIEALNTAIQKAASDGNDILVETLTTKRNALLIPVKIADTAAGVGDAITNTGRNIVNTVGNVGGNVSDAYQRNVGAIIDPVNAAGILAENEATRAFVEAKEEPILTTQSEAAKARAKEIAALSMSGSTGIASVDAADRMMDINKIPERGPNAVSNAVLAARKSANKPAGGGTSVGTSGGTSVGTSGGTSAGSGQGRIADLIADRKKQGDQDKWLALAQAGLSLMSSGDFGKAGQEGLAALMAQRAQMNKFDTDMLKLESDLQLNNARIAASRRSGVAKPKAVPAAFLTDLRKQIEATEAKLSNLRAPVPAGRIYGAAQDPDAAARDSLENELQYFKNQVALIYNQRNLGGAPADPGRTVVN